MFGMKIAYLIRQLLNESAKQKSKNKGKRKMLIFKEDEMSILRVFSVMMLEGAILSIAMVIGFSIMMAIIF